MQFTNFQEESIKLNSINKHIDDESIDDKFIQEIKKKIEDVVAGKKIIFIICNLIKSTPRTCKFPDPISLFLNY